MLDKIEWRSERDLSVCSLLEPAVGDGAFLVPAVTRLCESLHRHGVQLTTKNLVDRIAAFEIHRDETAKTRRRVRRILEQFGVSNGVAHRLSKVWIVTGDFLLQDFGDRRFTHIAGNPPYIRWSRVPPALRAGYEACLDESIARGDLCLAFVGRSLKLLSEKGMLGFLCSDRWLYAAYGQAFLNDIFDRFAVLEREPVDSSSAFQKSASAYPINLVMAPCSSRPKRSRSTGSRTGRPSNAQVTLKEAGYEVRVGPALGPESVFSGAKCDLDVEPELLTPYVGPRELTNDNIEWLGRYVICMHDEDGLRDLSKYPRLETYLNRHVVSLKKRALVKDGSDTWYRTIDRVMARVWARPKLLLPEMTKSPRAILDVSGFIPSHGIYAVFSPTDDVEALRTLIDREVLIKTLDAIAPRLNGGSYRCYKRFIEQVPVNVGA